MWHAQDEALSHLCRIQSLAVGRFEVALCIVWVIGTSSILDKGEGDFASLESDSLVYVIELQRLFASLDWKASTQGLWVWDWCELLEFSKLGIETDGFSDNPGL